MVGNFQTARLKPGCRCWRFSGLRVVGGLALLALLGLILLSTNDPNTRNDLVLTAKISKGPDSFLAKSMLKTKTTTSTTKMRVIKQVQPSPSDTFKFPREKRKLKQPNQSKKKTSDGIRDEENKNKGERLDIVKTARWMTAQNNAPPLLTIVNDAYIPLAFNWLCHTQNLGVHENIVLMVEGEQTMHQINKFWPNITTVSLQPPAPLEPSSSSLSSSLSPAASLRAASDIKSSAMQSSSLLSSKKQKLSKSVSLKTPLKSVSKYRPRRETGEKQEHKFQTSKISGKVKRTRSQENTEDSTIKGNAVLSAGISRGKFNLSSQPVPQPTQKETLLNGVLKFGTVGYIRMMVRRTQLLNRLLQAGVSLVLFETDFVWFTNPVPDFVNKARKENLDLVGTVSKAPEQIMCGGFIYFRSTPRMRRLWAEVTKQIEAVGEKLRGKGPGALAPARQNEQVFLNALLREGYAGAMYGLVDYSVVPDGAWYGAPKTKRANMTPKAAHNNFLHSVPEKVKRFKDRGHWFLNADQRTCIAQRIDQHQLNRQKLEAKLARNASRNH